MTAPKRGRPRLTHCWRGHALDDPANLKRLSNGQRQCRKCAAINATARYRERRSGAGLPWRKAAATLCVLLVLGGCVCERVQPIGPTVCETR